MNVPTVSLPVPVTLQELTPVVVHWVPTRAEAVVAGVVGGVQLCVPVLGVTACSTHWTVLVEWEKIVIDGVHAVAT
jgi:hypothetical protein